MLYVHVPFCHAKCAYCDFYSGRLRFDKQKFTILLLQELDMRREEVSASPQTIYIGGGTPSSLGPQALIALLEGLNRRLDMSATHEFTVEVNPEDVDDNLLSILAEWGVNRISMGIQSLNDLELAAIGRRHTARRAVEAVHLIKSAGFNLSCDLMFGLPEQSADSWQSSLAELIGLRPDHLSAYLLSYEPGTPLYARLSRGLLTEADDDSVTKMYATLTEMTARNGYLHYEISNYALPGRESRHNSRYWTDTPYLGIGPSAHSFDGASRKANTANISQWAVRVENSQLTYESESLSADDLHNEYVMKALRTSKGLDPQKVDPSLLPILNDMVGSGRLTPAGGSRLRIPEHEWLTADAVIRDLFL